MNRARIIASSIVTWLTLAAAVLGALAQGLADAGWENSQAGVVVAVVVTVVGILVAMATAALRHLAQVPSDVVGLTTEKHQVWLNDGELVGLAGMKQRRAEQRASSHGVASSPSGPGTPAA